MHAESYKKVLMNIVEHWTRN